MKDRTKRDIKFFMIGVLIWGVMTLGIFLAGGFTPVTEVPPTEIIIPTSTQLPSTAEPAADDVEKPATPRQGLPEPTPTVWAFSTPSWDVDNTWPYGITAMAIPIESTFDGSVKVYVLLGSDRMEHREHQDATDAIMLVLVDTDSDAATIISVPRDLYIYIPGFGMGRINVAWSLGGFETVRETIRYNFGLEVDGVLYGRIDTMKHFIDQGLGGITVSVREPIYEECGDLIINLSTGSAFMDGEYALCYARARMLTSDYSRMSRQQEILFAMKNRFFNRASQHPIEFAEALYIAYIHSGIQTDIPILDVPKLVTIAMDVEDNVDLAVIAPPLVEHFDHPETGAWLLLMQTPDVIYDFFRVALEH